MRRPAPVRPGPPPRVLAGLAIWAAALGLLGLGVGLRGLIVILSGHVPGWYEPTLILMGVLGIGLTAAAFLTVLRRPLPWLLLAGASVVLLASMIATGSA